MKIKMQLDAAGVKNWLLEHGEKLALGIVGIAVLLLTYSAIQREVLDAERQPDKLQALAGSVQSHVQNSTWDAGREELQVVNYTERAKTRLVDLESYPLTRPFNPPATDPKAKRGVPEVLAAEELRVGSGYDLFAVKAEKSADRGGASSSDAVLAQPWAVVTGLVPVARQQQAYEQMFRQAMAGGSDGDVPQYAVPVLERTPVDPADPKKVEWTNVGDVQTFEDRWGKPAAPVVSDRYRHEALTGRLGNLANDKQKWGEAVGHPKVPLVGDDKAANRARERRAQVKKGDPADQEEVIEYKLLRAFDYEVEPGKKYRYRVILRLQNPNFGLRPQQLKDPASARQEHLESEPSAATSVVTIPDGTRVLAGKVDAGTRYSEPTATLLVTAIDKNEGVEAGTEMVGVYRGTLANTGQKTVKARKPGGRSTVELTRDFRSGVLVLDIYGGKNLSNRRRDEPITSPGEILLLDAEGHMIVRNEIDDSAQYENTIVRDPAPENSKKSALQDDERSKRKPIRQRNR